MTQIDNNNSTPIKRIVLTGGPGAGKTAVLEALSRKGYAVGDDAARSIIRERKAAGLSPRPDPKTFATQILEKEVAAYDAVASGVMFYERSVADAAAFLHSLGAIDDSEAHQYLRRYPYDLVILFPPWLEIYRTDDERDHEFDHAVMVYESTRDWYLRFDHEVTEIPCVSVAQRVTLVEEMAASL